MAYACPLCNNRKGLYVIYTSDNLPLFQNVTCATYKLAINAKRADIALSHCPKCSLVFNSKFKHQSMVYDEMYDNEQSLSAHFSDYIDNLISRLHTDFGVRRKRILEIGCGKGAFLKRICEATESIGFGFDRTYDGKIVSKNVVFKPEYFKKQKKPFDADVIILRHVLEHIDTPFAFLKQITENVDKSKKPMFMIEVPDFEWIIKNRTFWDICYEHCNYFTKHSLHELAKALNLRVDVLFNTFGGQYMVLIATLGAPEVRKNSYPKLMDETLLGISGLFSQRFEEIRRLINAAPPGKEFAVWGASTKGTVLLASLDKKTLDRIKFAIDINKSKQDRYLAVSGKRIRSPDFLKRIPTVSSVIIMNPNYTSEIAKILKDIQKPFDVYNA